MITKTLIEKVKTSCLAEVDQYHIPTPFLFQYANEIGQRLARKFQADEGVVMLGTMLMDYKIGQAGQENRLPNHIQMSHEAAVQLLANDQDLTVPERENILNCILEHHGVPKFHSLESEIVCNADCYRFASVKGVVGGLTSFRLMELDKLVTLFKTKVEEKWQVLTLEKCKQELAPQYEVIKNFLAHYPL